MGYMYDTNISRENAVAYQIVPQTLSPRHYPKTLSFAAGCICMQGGVQTLDPSGLGLGERFLRCDLRNSICKLSPVELGNPN